MFESAAIAMSYPDFGEVCHLCLKKKLEYPDFGRHV
jgi:hypothetical protein